MYLLSQSYLCLSILNSFPMVYYISYFFNLFGSFQFHDYLNLIRVLKYKYSLIKLRLSSHRLAVETGKWNKPHPIPLEERKCRFCTSLEDEFHFLFECKLHDGIRKTYIQRYYWNRPNIPKLYPTKKKRTTTIFPFASPFNTKMLIVMKYSFLINFY